ncbi:MAG: ABC transporter permease, partial [Monoglobus pectinilyticus]
MKRYLFCEYKKTRRKYIFVMAVAITAVALCWGLYGKYNESALKSGWMMMLYQLPLLNTIFMPLLSIVVASRFAGIETSMMKQLCSVMPKQRLYDAKLIYSLSIILLSLLIQFVSVYIAGRCFGFSGRFPIELYALYFMFT